MTFHELAHARPQLYACRSHEADLPLEVERRRAGIVARNSEPEAVVDKVAVAAESIGRRLRHLVRRHQFDADDPPHREGTARDHWTASGHESVEALTAGKALDGLLPALRRRSAEA